MNSSIAVLCAPLLIQALPASAGEQGPRAQLELCYATSISMPEENFGPENVFDGDPATFWATMPGAAPDEGIFFSFEEPVFIRTIRIGTVTGDPGYGEIESCQLYINGIEGYIDRNIGHPGWIFSEVKTIFVRIRSTDSTERDGDGIRHSGGMPVGISEITLMVTDDEGDEVPLRVIPVREVGGSVEASSSLQPVEAYCPDFLFDSRPAFGWADGNPGRTGDGERLTFLFDEEVRIEKIRIWNGYHRSEAHYVQNERVREFSFSADGGGSQTYLLDDTMEPSVIELETPLTGSSFDLEVIDVYEGSVYRDLVISELRFFDGEEWFVLRSGAEEARKLGVLEWARNAPAGVIVDRQVYRESFDPHSGDYRLESLLLRSNGSFVIWKHQGNSENDPGDQESMYADGNWQILGDSSVRIFGRLQRVGRYDTMSYDPYVGIWSDQGREAFRMIVFSDTLHVADGRVTSSRGLFGDLAFQ